MQDAKICLIINIDMQWEILDRNALAKVIENLVPANMPPMFSLASSEAKFAKLPFYTNFKLFRLTNNASLPSFSIDFLSDGIKYLYLDGSPSPIYRVNATGDLILNDNTILDYMVFYVQYVSDENGEILMVDSNKEPLPAGFMDIERHRKAIYTHREINLNYDEENRIYKINMPICYGGTLVDAKISVNSMGHLNIDDYQMMLKRGFADRTTV